MIKEYVFVVPSTILSQKCPIYSTKLSGGFLLLLQGSVYECQANVIFEVLSSSLILRKSANKSSNLELYHKIVWLFMPSQVLLSILIKWLVGAICKIGRAPKINSDT